MSMDVDRPGAGTQATGLSIHASNPGGQEELASDLTSSYHIGTSENLPEHINHFLSRRAGDPAVKASP